VKKLLLGCLALGISISVQAKQCAVPANKIEIGSVKLYQNLQSFKQVHPTGKLLGNRIDMFDTDYAFAREGIMAIGFIDFDISKNRIIGFTLNYTEGKYADFDTPIETFKNNIIKHSSFPKTGWGLSKDKETYSYTCDDYKLFIKQDHGAGRGALGAVVWVFSRYSDSF
jgi:hypothetical protein